MIWLVYGVVWNGMVCGIWYGGMIYYSVVWYGELWYGMVCGIRAANYCRTSDNVRLNLANVRAKVILIGHWSDHKKKLSHTFFCCDKIRLQIHSICSLQ